MLHENNYRIYTNFTGIFGRGWGGGSGRLDYPGQRRAWGHYHRRPLS